MNHRPSPDDRQKPDSYDRIFSLRRDPCLFLWLPVLLILALTSGVRAQPAQTGTERSFQITILYDNTTHTPGTKASWGFACMIEGGEKNILFDTGSDALILRQNAEALHMDLGRADMVVLSHNHGDHSNGMSAVLQKKKGLRILLPKDTPDALMDTIKDIGSRPERVSAAMQIDPRVFLVPTEGNGVAEISLALPTADGAMVITGCAHPGVVHIVRQAGEIAGRKITALLGGFHLLNDPPEKVDRIIADLKGLGVRRCSATHCTGEKVIARFQQSFAENFLPAGVGSTILP